MEEGLQGENGVDMDDDAASDDSSASETDLQQQITELEATLKDSPYHYNSHLEVIQLLRQLGDLDRARQARQRMRELFPLNEELWLQWFQDELPLASLPEACTELRALFERATEDYLSVPVWLEYAKFAVDKMSVMPEGMEFPRDVFERAIIACGLHVNQAGTLWDAYREFEVAVLGSLQEMQRNDPSDDTMKSQVEIQFERVDKLFRRQLAVPLIGLGTTFQEYQKFSETDVTEDSLPAYARAKKKLKEYQPFENDLGSSTPPTLESYRSYLSHVKSHKDDPTFINTLYQRAVAHHPLETELWKEYLLFLNHSFSRVKLVLLVGHKQAVRNCPWVVEFWVSKVRAQERAGEDHEEIMATFEMGLVGNFSSSKDYLQLWTAFCDYLRRRVGQEEGEGEREGRITELRKTFKRARDEIETYYGRDGDPTDSLSRYQARLEVGCYDNIEEARLLWDDVMTRHGKEAEFWLEYAQMERYCGEVANSRKILQRSVNSASDDPERVCQALLELERDVGTLEDYEAALERCAAQLRRVQERKDKATEKESRSKEEKKQRKKMENVQKKADAKTDQQRQQQTKGSKRKRPQAVHVYYDDDSDEQRPAKKQKAVTMETQQPLSSPDKKQSITTSESDTSMEVTMATDKFAANDTPPKEKPPKDKDHPKKIPVPPGARERLSKEQLWRAGRGEAERGGGGGVEVEGGGGGGGEAEGGVEGGVEVEVEGSKESRTVFVSNLLFTVTEKQLEEKFSECGTVTDVRLIKTRARAGRGNVYAYVEFSSPTPVQEALQLDRTLLDDRPMFVSPFREKGVVTGATGPTTFKYAGTSKATVYVSSIPHHTTESDLEEIFKECGEVKEVRLVRNRAGRSKGFAYIEYCEEPSANAAVLKLDNHQIGLKWIQVAISNPPKKALVSGTEDFQRPTFAAPRALGVRPPEPANPLARKSKTHISLLPRVVARREEKTAGKEGEGGGSKMSNEDFRKMLLKK